MKISCQSCQAKYTIADEKVLGKIVKIRCKKCSATIVINGNETAAAAAPTSEQQDQNVFDYTAQGAGGEQWTVNVADGDQRTLTSTEVCDAYKQGVVNDETYCWKDGMSDWLPLREIDALYAAATMGPRPSLAPDGSMPQADEQPTKIQESNLGSLFAAAQAPVQQPHAQMMAPQSNGNGGGGFFAQAAASPAAAVGGGAAARRAGGRGAQGADLFGGVAQAGGEDDVMTSAPAGMSGSVHPPAGDGKLTGQRNENSVLFSLTALTQNAPKEETSSAIGEGSGLIDIRALSAAMEPKDQKTNRVDDIMNLAGGGAFTPALAAPVLGPPAMESMDYGSGASSQQQKSNKTLLLALIALGGLLLVAVTIVLVVVLTRKPDAPGAATPGTNGTSTTGTSTAQAGSTSTTTQPTAAATDTATAAPTGTTTATAATATAATAATGGVKPPTTAATTAPPPTTPTVVKTATARPPGPCGCASGDIDCAIRCSMKKH